jgi:hypothetical protein
MNFGNIGRNLVQILKFWEKISKITQNHNKSTKIFDIPTEITISHRWCGSKNPSSSAPSNSDDDGQERLQANAMWPCRSGCRRCWTTRAAPTVPTARASSLTQRASSPIPWFSRRDWGKLRFLVSRFFSSPTATPRFSTSRPTH